MTKFFDVIPACAGERLIFFPGIKNCLVFLADSVYKGGKEIFAHSIPGGENRGHSGSVGRNLKFNIRMPDKGEITYGQPNQERETKGACGEQGPLVWI